MNHGHSPADILRAALIEGGMGALPSGTLSPRVALWPIYAGHLPDVPDNALCVYDTSGQKDGRDYRTGQTITHPGFQIRLRTTDAATGWAKVRTLLRFLDTIKRQVITLGDDRYRIDAITQTGTPLALGQEPDAKRREAITINGTMTLQELEP